MILHPDGRVFKNATVTNVHQTGDKTMAGGPWRFFTGRDAGEPYCRSPGWQSAGSPIGNRRLVTGRTVGVSACVFPRPTASRMTHPMGDPFPGGGEGEETGGRGTKAILGRCGYTAFPDETGWGFQPRRIGRSFGNRTRPTGRAVCRLGNRRHGRFGSLRCWKGLRLALHYICTSRDGGWVLN